MKLFVKLRESGEVKEVVNISYPNHVKLVESYGSRSGEYFQLGDDCDLCDEQGRLLVAQDEEMFEKLESLSNRYEVIDGQYVIRKQNLDALINELKEGQK